MAHKVDVTFWSKNWKEFLGFSVSPQTLCMSLGYIDRGKIVMNGADFLNLFCGSTERFTETTPEIIFSLLFSFHGKLMSVGLSIPWHPFCSVLYRRAGSL